MKNKVLYWDGLIGDEDLIKKHKPLILKLINGEYESAHLDLKKVKGHRVQSVWTEDKADRILFVTEDSKEHGRCILLLGEVPNHDYQKSPFMKPAVLSAFLENKAPTLVDNARAFEDEELIFEDCDKPLFDKKNNSLENDFDEYAVTFHNQQFLSLDINQQESIYAPYPVLINGVLGSGKTLCAESFIEKELDPNNPKKLLYITQSDGLVFEREKQWQAHPSAQQNHSEVSFNTYETLIKKLYPHLKNHTKATKEICVNWLHYYKKHFPLKSTVDDTLYQEFRILSAFDEKSYLDLGENQCLIHEGIEKKEIYKAFLQYKKYLRENKLLDASLFQFNEPIEPLYDFIVVDEAQDFSHLQLQQLQKLVLNNCILYCMDTNQSLHDATSKLSYLTALTYPNKPVEFFNSHRCPGPIVQFNNHLLNIKFKLTGGLSDKKEHRSIKTLHSEKPCHIQWVDLPMEDEEKLSVLFEKYKNLKPLVEKYPYLLPILEKHSHFAPLFNEDENLASLFDGSTHRAIITLPQYKKEAKILFSTTLVFTAEEIKGLEFDTIIHYQTLDKEIFKKASEKLARKANSQDRFFKSAVHLPKNGGGENCYVTSMNEIVTNNGRSTQKLYLFQRNERKLEHLIGEMKQGLLNLNTIAPTEEVSKLTWWQTFIKLVEAKQFEQAYDTLVKLQKSNALFEDLYQYIAAHPKPIINKEKPSSWDVFRTEVQNNQPDKAKVTFQEKFTNTKELFDCICTHVHFKKEDVIEKESQNKNVNNTNSDTTTKPPETQKETNTNNNTDTKSPETPKATNANSNAVKEKATTEIKSNKPTTSVSQIKKQSVATNNNSLTIPKKTIVLAPEENLGPELTQSERKYVLDLAENSLNKKKFARFFKDKRFDYLMFEANLTIENIRMPFFTYLVDKANCYPQLLDFFKEYKFLVKKITPERICKIFNFKTNKGTSFKNASLLLLLSSPTKHALFELLLINNDKLAEGITVEALCRKALLFINGISTKTDTHEGDFCTPIQFLTIDSDTVKHLAFILRKNPLKIPAIALFEDPFILKKELIPTNSEIVVSTLNSAFYNLCSSKIGIQLLEMIFDNNPSLYQEITAKELCKPCIESDEFEKKNINITPLYLLSTRPEGRQFLLKLFTENTTLAANIPQDLWFLSPPSPEGDPIKRSPAGYIYSEEGELKDLVHKTICLNNCKEDIRDALSDFSLEDNDSDETDSDLATYLSV